MLFIGFQVQIFIYQNFAHFWEKYYKSNLIIHTSNVIYYTSFILVK